VEVEKIRSATEPLESEDIPDNIELVEVEETSNGTQVKLEAECPTVQLELLPSNTSLSPFDTLYKHAESSSSLSKGPGTTLFLAL